MFKNSLSDIIYTLTIYTLTCQQVAFIRCMCTHVLH